MYEILLTTKRDELACGSLKPNMIHKSDYEFFPLFT